MLELALGGSHAAADEHLRLCHAAEKLRMLGLQVGKGEFGGRQADLELRDGNGLEPLQVLLCLEPCSLLTIH